MVRLVDVRAQVGALLTTGQGAQTFVNKAFDTDRRNTRFVRLARVAQTASGWRSTTVTKIPGERARYHLQKVRPADPTYRGSVRSCSHLRVDCDCKRYLYVWNHALFTKDLALFDRTNGNPPVITNSTGQPGICKHGIIVLRYLVRSNPQCGRGVRESSGPVLESPVRTGTAPNGGRLRPSDKAIPAAPGLGRVSLSTIRRAR